MAKLIVIRTKTCFHLCSILTIILFFMPSQSHSSTHEEDVQALREMKKSVDPSSVPPYSYLNSWDFTVDPCESTGSQFLGLLCNIPIDNSSSRVTALELDSIGYDGFLSAAIGNLAELTTLNLDKNKFRGPIPDTITTLRKLTRLTLSGNVFTGGIPAGISALKRLEYLDLSRNKLSGTIPMNITALRSLTYLSLSNNGFEGRIPELTGLWQLRTLDISINQFYGNIPKIPGSLRRLYLSHNILTGHMTPLKSLSHLKWLDVSDNKLSGSINREILSSLRGVVRLNVSFNRFSALEVINYSAQRPRLQVLDAQGNNLRSHLPVNLVTYQNLTVINLANNQFSGSIPKEYGEKMQTSWKRLYLDHNFLTGNLPYEFTHSDTTQIRGSLAHNCLRCPTNILLCHGGQRPSAECVGQHDV